MKMSLIAAFLATVCLAQVGGLMDSPSSSAHGQFVSIAPVAKVQVKPGAPGTVALHFTIKSGMHINSHKPLSDLLIPTTLKLSAGNDLATGGISYPPGQEFSLSGSPDDKLNIYSGEFVVSSRISATRKAMPGNFTIHGELKYQACDDRSCFPPKTLPIQFDVAVVNPSAIRQHGSYGSAGQSPHILGETGHLPH